MASRRGNATAPASNASAGAPGSSDVNDEHGEVPEEEEYVDQDVQRILSRVDLTAEERMLAADDGDLPVLSWEDTAEVKGGNLTDMGFAKLMPGFEFRGYIIGTKKMPSEFGKEEIVLDSSNRAVMDQATGQPMTRKMQEVYMLKGTARFPVKGAIPGTFGQCAGRMNIPVYARLDAPIAENMAKEKALTDKARAKNPAAPAVKIPLHIRYVGQNPDKETKEGVKSRSGAHMFHVVRLRVTEPAAPASP